MLPTPYPSGTAIMNQPMRQMGYGYVQQIPLGRFSLEAFFGPTNAISIRQNVDLAEAILGTLFDTGCCEQANSYQLLSMGTGLSMYAQESSDWCSRCCCGPCRSFDMDLLDHLGNSMIRIERPLRCIACCFPCCLQKLSVYAEGRYIGSINQRWFIVYPAFNIRDHSDNKIYKIEGPLCKIACCGGDVTFKVMDPSGNNQLGEITKKWSGILREGFTDADNFIAVFPQNAPLNHKILILGAVFLIDFMYFEQSGQNDPSTQLLNF